MTPQNETEFGMIVYVRASNQVEVSDVGDDGVKIVTHPALLPYLAGILRLHGIGTVREDVVRLDPTWIGRNSNPARPEGLHTPEWAQITTHADAI
ncbi:hypothetical protein IA539_20925 [Gordonia sp. zg691]|uniref:hypothetical protein n=1 Tax=Gordonia jinghuaiqii TaxID=2758710 RepID=UPI0016624855|nr:hypothetical protein [Gordonia jinghuaiqii]MBD0863641.1 hypothetical protein [Gordonia jinghuaiqii]